MQPELVPADAEGLAARRAPRSSAWRIEGTDVPLAVWTIDTSQARPPEAWRAFARQIIGEAEPRTPTRRAHEPREMPSPNTPLASAD